MGLVPGIVPAAAHSDDLCPRIQPRHRGAHWQCNPSVFHETPLVVTEGKYLLLDLFGWQAVRPLLDDATCRHANLLVHLATTLGSPTGSATTTASSMSERPEHGSVE